MPWAENPKRRDRLHPSLIGAYLRAELRTKVLLGIRQGLVDPRPSLPPHTSHHITPTKFPHDAHGFGHLPPCCLGNRPPPRAAPRSNPGHSWTRVLARCFLCCLPARSTSPSSGGYRHGQRPERMDTVLLALQRGVRAGRAQEDQPGCLHLLCRVRYDSIALFPPSTAHPRSYNILQPSDGIQPLPVSLLGYTRLFVPTVPKPGTGVHVGGRKPSSHQQPRPPFAPHGEVCAC